MADGALVALGGTLFGWLLKSSADGLAWTVKERRQFRKATFAMLKAYRHIALYERAAAFFQTENGGHIRIFEPARSTLQDELLNSFTSNEKAFTEALDTLGGIEPAPALELERAISRLHRVFGGMLESAAKEGDAEIYSQLLSGAEHLVDLTLDVLEGAITVLASRTGYKSKSEVKRWLSEHQGSGRAEFLDGMAEQREARERAGGPGTQDFADRWWSARSGADE